MRLVLVEWQDSRTSESGWRYLSDGCDVAAVRCRSVGWVLHEAEDVVVLAQSLGDLDSSSAQSMGRTAIARRQIIQILDLMVLSVAASLAGDPGLESIPIPRVA